CLLLSTLFPYTTLFRSLSHSGLTAYAVLGIQPAVLLYNRALILLKLAQFRGLAVTGNESRQTKRPFMKKLNPATCLVAFVFACPDRKSTRLNSSHQIIS